MPSTRGDKGGNKDKGAVNTNVNKSVVNTNHIKSATVMSSDTDFYDGDIDLVDLSNDQRKIISFFDRKLAMITSDFETKLAIKETKIDQLSTELVELRRKVLALDDKQEDADAYERKDTVIISGSEVPAAADGEDAAQIVSSLVKNKVGYFLRPAEISVAHRLGKKPLNQAPDRRSLIVKLCRREVKRDLVTACRTAKPPNLYVNESLTKTRSTVLFGLRQAKKKHPNVVAGCGSADGRVFAWIMSPNPSAPNAKNVKIFINTRDKFEDFCKKTLKCNSFDFFLRLAWILTFAVTVSLRDILFCSVFFSDMFFCCHTV